MNYELREKVLASVWFKSADNLVECSLAPEQIETVTDHPLTTFTALDCCVPPLSPHSEVSS